ncbi:hypothetical protein BKA24_001679 [Microbacterium marinum]|uniref:Peptidase family M23 n=1 Tax=Microbacterium marinum TaxID=421115 RepID=A0A7W7BQH0_9MICO|nr:hypothetical protein [Microbacterium marinum]MBB4666970.1 hypothetical protein [Microbacterium marinum]
MSKRFFDYPVTADRAEHARRGVGAATDYACPMGSLVDAPFAGALTRRDTSDGGFGLRLTGDRFVFVAQHLSEPVKPGRVAWRSGVARSGNTGTATTGPHVHAWILVRATGERLSFEEWLDRYVEKSGKPAPKPAPKPTPAKVARTLVGREIVLGSWYWYATAAAAVAMRGKRGKGKGQTMLSGPYTIRKVASNGAILVRSNANGDVWLHPSAANKIRK